MAGQFRSPLWVRRYVVSLPIQGIAAFLTYSALATPTSLTEQSPRESSASFSHPIR